MLDVAVAYNRFRFVGDEFLTWLWFVIDNEPDKLRSADKDLAALEVGNRIVLENNQRESVERITIKGDQAGLEEGLLALQKGALVTEINLVYRQADKKWQFNLKGESLNISGFKVPDVARPQTRDDLEGFVLEKIYLYERVATFLENIFNAFVRLRLSNQWTRTVVPEMQKWFKT
jgi:hypothetical protein